MRVLRVILSIVAIVLFFLLYPPVKAGFPPELHPQAFAAMFTGLIFLVPSFIMRRADTRIVLANCSAALAVFALCLAIADNACPVGTTMFTAFMIGQTFWAIDCGSEYNGSWFDTRKNDRLSLIQIMAILVVFGLILQFHPL